MQPLPAISEHDFIRGDLGAPLQLVQYGDFECPYSGAAFRAIDSVRQLLGEQLVYIFRHFPLYNIHPHAWRASEAAQAAADQGLFWEMHDLLFKHQMALSDEAIHRYAQTLNLDTERFWAQINAKQYNDAISSSIAGGRSAGVHGTPTFFINGTFHDNREGLWTDVYLLEALQQSL